MLDRPDAGSVALEIINPGLRIKGLLDVPGSRRISDLLNDQAETLVLHNVRFGTLEGTLLDTMAEFTVDKASIVIAFPWESAGYLAARRADRFGIAPPKLPETPVRVAVPPFLVHGLLRVAAASGTPSLLIRALNHFFVLTDGFVELNKLVVGEAPAVIINRDFVLGVGRLDQKGHSTEEQREVQPHRIDEASKLGGLS